MKKRIIAAFLTAALITGIFAGTPVAHEATVAAEAAGTAEDPVLTDENDHVIVIDPGHGGSDSGAVRRKGNSKVIEALEKNLNLQIATAIKNRLSQYAGVTALMTRTKDEYVGLVDRTNYAAKVHADAFISVHLNAASPTARGAEVWYPNSHYDSNCYNVGKKLANSILDSLKKLGLASRGIAYKNSQGGGKYPDGSLADYYSVIRTSKEAHIPGIIIESAFITNDNDYKKFLNTKARTNKLGITEADAIAKALGLSKRKAGLKLPSRTTLKSAKLTGNSNAVKVTWKKSANSSKYLVFRKAAGGTWQEIGRTSKTSYTDNTGNYGTTYYYTVIGRNNNGRATSYDTKGKKVTTPTHNITITKAVDSGLQKVTIKWKRDKAATGYRVYRRTADDQYHTIAILNGNKTTSYTDQAAAKNTTYAYVVRSFVNRGKYTYPVKNGKRSYIRTVWSTYKDAGTRVKTDADESGTLNGTLSADNKSITFTWSRSNDPDAVYRLYRKTGSGKYKRLAETKELTYTDTGIKAGKKYKYKLRYYRSQVRSSKKVHIFSSFTNVLNYTIPKGTVTPVTPTDPVKPVTPAKPEVKITVSQVKLRSAYESVKYKYNEKDDEDYNADAKDYVTPLSETSLILHWKTVRNADGYQIYNGKVKKLITINGGKTNSYTFTGLKKRTSYTYKVRAFRNYNGKNYYGDFSVTATGKTPYLIKGKSKTSVAQMVRYYNTKIAAKKKAYPADTYKKYGAATIKDFVTIVNEEAKRAGVKSEVLFGQICLETGFLTFGGDVKASQCNFGGIGATGGGNAGMNFVKYAKYYYKELTDKNGKTYKSAKAAKADAVRVGIRAQAVHLSLYATTDGNYPEFRRVDSVKEYPQSTVPDPRAYSTVIGGAPYCEWLGIKDNPNTTGEATKDGKPVSKGWATGNNYGYNLVDLYIEPMLSA